MPFWMLGHSSFDRFLFREQRISRVDYEYPPAADLTSDALKIRWRIMHGMFVAATQKLAPDSLV
jgi:hypothetical protein